MIAAVSVVLPWSMWPIVPTLTCGLVRSNFFFAIVGSLPGSSLRPGPPGRLAGLPACRPLDFATSSAATFAGTSA